MKFLHVGDLHLGKMVNGFSMLEDQRVTLERLLDDAEAASVGVLVLSGDLYDRSMPSAEAVALLDWFLTEATARGFQVLAIPGNHDSAERVSYASALLERQGVHVPPAFDGSLASVVLEDEFGTVAFWLMPFLRPSSVRPFFEEKELGADYTEALRCVLEAAPIDYSQRNVLVAHQFVLAGELEPTRSDSEVAIGGVDGVDAALFEGFDYVALGHLHRPQKVGRETVRYAGSLLKYSFSEARGQKSAVLVSLGPKGEDGVDFSLLPLRPPHDLREVEGPLEELVSREALSEADPGDYIHAIITDDEPPADALARLRAAFPRLMAMDVSNASTRHEADLSRIEADEEMDDPLTLFERFFEEQNARPLTPAQRAVLEEVFESCLVAGEGRDAS